MPVDPVPGVAVALDGERSLHAPHHEVDAVAENRVLRSHPVFAPDNAEKHVELDPAFERARLASGFLLGLDGEAFKPRDVETSGSGRWITVRVLTWITIRSLLTRGESLPFVH